MMPDKDLTDDVLDEIIAGAKTSMEQYLALSLKAERAAMPGKSEPVSQPYTLPDGKPSFGAMMRALDAFYADEDVPENAMLAAFKILIADMRDQAAQPVAVPDERAAFNKWNNDTDCPLAGLTVKQAAWLAWLKRSGTIKSFGSPEQLQPSRNALQLPELSDAQCLEFLSVAFRHASISGDIEFDDIRLGLKMALQSAPQVQTK